jgi:hypothetical protein
VGDRAHRVRVHASHGQPADRCGANYVDCDIVIWPLRFVMIRPCMFPKYCASLITSIRHSCHRLHGRSKAFQRLVGDRAHRVRVHASHGQPADRCGANYVDCDIMIRPLRFVIIWPCMFPKYCASLITSILALMKNLTYILLCGNLILDCLCCGDLHHATMSCIV